MIDSFAPVNPAIIDAPLDPSLLIDGHPGYPADKAAGDTLDVLKDVCGDASRDFPDWMWIEPRHWAEFYRDNGSGMNFLDRFTNQGPGGGGYSTHECTCHSLVTNCLAAMNRQRGIIFAEGPKVDFRYEESAIRSFWLSALSVYIEANPRERGGAGIRQVLEIAVRRGILPDKTQPREYNLTHSLHGTCGKGGKNQSRGPWVSLGELPEGWQETAKHFKPKAIIFPSSWEQAVCLCLHNRLVSVGRGGHAVPWAQPMFSGVNFSGLAYPDSYDTIRVDSLGTVKSAWSGAFSVDSMTTPDDWLKPAENVAA